MDNFQSFTNQIDKLFGTLRLSFSIYSLIDISVVAVLLYMLFIFLRETKALVIIYGLIILSMLWLLGQLLQLNTLNTILRWSITSLLVALPVVFQPELRSGLERLGRTTYLVSDFRRLSKSQIETIIDEIVTSINILAKNSYGALIVIARTNGLYKEISSGEYLMANVNSKLLVNIFTPKAPLHDGAVIIKGNQIICASATLPLDEDVLDLSLGTRHKAAISLSKQTDAIVLVVSEETGQISMSINGKINKNITPDALKSELIKIVSSKKTNDK